MTTFELAATVVIGTALVLAPIDPQPIRDLNTPEPAPEPAPAPTFDEALTRRVCTALGLRYRKPRADVGETETRISVWSQMELNDLYERVGGTVTSRPVERTACEGDATWAATEITVTVDLPGIGLVEIVTDLEDDPEHGYRLDIPVVQALATKAPAVTLTKDAVTLHDIATNTVWRRMDHHAGEHELALCRGLGDTIQDYETVDHAGNPLRVVLQIDAPREYAEPDQGGIYLFTR